MNKEEEKLYNVLLELLHSIKKGDVKTYTKLSHPNLSCFEPETQGHPVDGLSFHQFLIENTESNSPYHLEIIRPIIRIYNQVGYTAYTLLTTYWEDGKPKIKQVNETRIFHEIAGDWKMVHFHRSSVKLHSKQKTDIQYNFRFVIINT